ncbi:MAG: hypothetical protein CME71_12140 [Halobacteriovorax sp.]|nr:hypothetical protein [Halobacteriovorax sp.]|tara:strand:- start:6389 stop:6880 length:492 start_codon:yes stop_codon:yes gene_type:complete
MAVKKKATKKVAKKAAKKATKKVAKKATKKAAAKKTTKKAAKKTAKKATKKVAAKKATKKVAAKKATKKKVAAKKKTKTKRKPNAAFMKAMTPSAALSEFVGNKPLPRTQAVKKFWDYIKKHDLQDAKNRRQINANGANLEKLFGAKSITMFDLAKIINKHLS